MTPPIDLPGANTREADFGVNYFLRDGLKGIVSYGRQFSSAGNSINGALESPIGSWFLWVGWSRSQ